MDLRDRIILALDDMSIEDAVSLTRKVRDLVYGVKINILHHTDSLFVSTALSDAGADKVWVDAKLHDIPNTVGKCSEEILRNAADIITVHASGGVEAMKEAVGTGLVVYAVTVLSSLSEADVWVLFRQTPNEVAYTLASWAQKANVAGIVCSPLEVAFLSQQEELRPLEFIVPGVRSIGAETHDQQRIDTPLNALINGATRLVVGRQVTESSDPIEALQKIFEEISDVS